MKAAIVKLSYVMSQRVRLDPGYYLDDPSMYKQLESSKKALESLKKSVATQKANIAAHRRHIQDLKDQGVLTPL